jgi:lysozyme family protein
VRENLERAMSFTLSISIEGNKVHKVAGDHGGLTAPYGLTLKTMKALFIDLNSDGVVNEKDVSLVTLPVVEKAFRRYFWNKIDGDNLPGGLDLMLADVAWNSGPGRAREFIQEGYKTPEALLARRLNYYELLAKKPSQRKFLEGWKKRANASYEEALKCVKEAKA